MRSPPRRVPRHRSLRLSRNWSQFHRRQTTTVAGLDVVVVELRPCSRTCWRWKTGARPTARHQLPAGIRPRPTRRRSAVAVLNTAVGSRAAGSRRPLLEQVRDGRGSHRRRTWLDRAAPGCHEFQWRHRHWRQQSPPPEHQTQLIHSFINSSLKTWGAVGLPRWIMTNRSPGLLYPDAVGLTTHVLKIIFLAWTINICKLS